MNSLKSIYSRITSIQPAVDLLEELGIYTKDAAGEMRRVENVLGELATQWKDLSAEQQQNLGLQIAGKHICQPSQKWLENNTLNSGKPQRLGNREPSLN